MSDYTLPRQVRVNSCYLYSPGMELRVPLAQQQAVRERGINIFPYIQKIDLYESIFDNTLSGAITLMENEGLVEFIPIVGVERVFLSFSVYAPYLKNGAQTFGREFQVTKVSGLSYPKHDYRLYTLNLATPEFVNSLSARISRPFNAMTCAEGVLEVLSRDLNVSVDRIVNIEQTDGALNTVIPNYTPLQAINYFALLAQTVDRPRESNYLFFETLEGFHFTSISSLIKQGHAAPTLKTLNVNPGMVSVRPKVTIDQMQNTIDRLHQEQTFDLLMDIGSGMLRSEVVHFDFLARQYKSTDSRYTKTFKDTTHLDKYPVYPENYDQALTPSVRTFTVPSNFWVAQSDYAKQKGEEIPEQRMREAIVLRNRQLREIKHIETLLTLPGQPGLRAGSVVIVNYPSTRLLQGSDAQDNAAERELPTPYHSGKHLVTEVHHELSQQAPGAFEYTMTIKVNRDSLGAPLIGMREQ